MPARSPMPLMVHSTCRAPACDGGDRVGDRHPEVVVVVRRQRDAVADAAADRREHPRDVGGQRVADRVRQVHRRRAGLDHRLRDVAEKRQVAPGRVFGRELDVRRSARARSARRRGPGPGRSPGRCAACTRGAGPRWRERRESAAAPPPPAPPTPGRCRRSSPAPARQSTGRATAVATARTASKSPSEEIGKPASMMSTPRRSSCWARRTFSAGVMLNPGPARHP